MRLFILFSGLFLFLSNCGLNNKDAAYYFYHDKSCSEEEISLNKASTCYRGEVMHAGTDQIRKSLKQCKLEALAKVPSRTLIKSTPSYTSPISCNSLFGTVSCTGGNTSGGQVYSVDENDGLRDEVRKECLSAKKIFQTYPGEEVPMCPEWSLGGWYAGQLTAEELASIHTEYIVGLFYNEPILYHRQANEFNRHCIITASKGDISPGVTAKRSAFPENFVKMPLVARETSVLLQQYHYDKKKNIWRNVYSSFDQLVVSMQARIDFCTGKISTEQMLNRYLGKPGKGVKGYTKNLNKTKKDLCNSGELKF